MLELENRVAAKTSELLETSKFAALGQMAGGIAHEINTPLASIQLACENILDIGNQAPGVQDELKRETETVVRSAERINVIIQGLRTFSKNDRKAAARSETVHSLIEEALSLTREQLRAEKLDLRLRPGDVELKVRARSIDVTQILLNLITNACDATQGLDDRWIEIDFAGVGDASVAIRVTDSGPGIKLEHRARLFEPFFTTKAIGAGTGLGLSVARNLADANGGTLELDVSAKNTRFVLKLPQSSE
jgi:C4-dicarboxylate-specific signal transduction histidine kinase